MDEKIWSKFLKNTIVTNDNVECWEWVGYINKENLPVFVYRDRDKQRGTSARKFAWEFINGKTDGIELRSYCGNHKCVKPDHHYLNTPENGFWMFVYKTNEDECWEWNGALDSMGYGCFRGGKSHRFSYKIHFGEFDKNLDVLHVCDNRKCVNPKHLFLGTHSENMKDMVEKGRSKRGENSGKHKLTNKDVYEIRKRISQGDELKTISKDFNVSPTAICSIKSGRTWSWLP